MHYNVVVYGCLTMNIFVFLPLFCFLAFWIDYILSVGESVTGMSLSFYFCSFISISFTRSFVFLFLCLCFFNTHDLKWNAIIESTSSTQVNSIDWHKHKCSSQFEFLWNGWCLFNINVAVKSYMMTRSLALTCKWSLKWNCVFEHKKNMFRLKCVQSFFLTSSEPLFKLCTFYDNKRMVDEI